MIKRFFKVFIISAIVFGLLFFIFGEKILLNDNSDIALDNNNDILPTNQDNLTFLVVGIDTYDITETSGKRSDTMIVANVDFKNHTMKLLSIPRDTRVLKSNGYYDKINHAHAYNGIQGSLDAVNKLLDLNINHYVKIDYQAVEQIVDSIGGVEIDIPFDMKYEDTTEGNEFFVDLKQGRQRLNGEQSLQFLRWRKNNDGEGYPEGDIGRINAQQMFIKELIKQSLRPRNILKTPKFISIYNKYIDTNIPLKTVFKGAWTGMKIDLDTLDTYTLPGEGQYINDISYFIHYENETIDLVNKYFK